MSTCHQQFLVKLKKQISLKTLFKPVDTILEVLPRNIIPRIILRII